MSLDILSTDPGRPGIFAFGQEAHGVFAFGQLATGVVAVGQIARGVIAVGQCAVGVVAVGQVGMGVLYAGGMMAVGGRGFGVCLKVLPQLVLLRHERPSLPPLSSLEELREQERGWLLAEIRDGALRVEGREAPLELEDEAREKLREAVAAGHNFACVTVRVDRRLAERESAAYRRPVGRETRLVGVRLSSWFEGPPRVHLRGPLTGLGGLLLRSLGMLGLVAAWWFFAGEAILPIFR